MSESGGLKKFTIVPLKKNVDDGSSSYSLDTDNKVEAQFNPETFQIQKANAWTFKPDIGDNLPEAFFGGGEAGITSVDLLFDTTDTGGDVQTKYIKLYQLAMVDKSSGDSEKAEPKQVLLMWGQNVIGDPMVISKITQDLIYFKQDGTPLRARIKVCFKQVWDSSKKGGTNPTSRSYARRTWMVEHGQRLDWIAYQEYGDTSAWRHIAETNSITDPLALRAGQILKLVPLE